jgi:copper(I)-binding protein
VTALPAASRPARRRIAVSLLACAALLTSACAAGQHAQSAEQTPAIDGAGGNVGTVQLHAVALAGPAGGPSYAVGQNAALNFVVVNTGTQPDTLTGITSAVASGATTAQTAADAAGLIGTPSASASDSSSSTDTSSPTDTTSASTPPTTGSFSPIQIAAGTSQAFGVQPTDPVVVLTGLKQQLFPGTQISVTFTFQSAGSVTITVPIALTTPTSPLSVSPPAGAGSG